MADVINLAFQISADLKGVQSQLRTLEGNVSQSFGKIQGMAAGLGRQLAGVLGVGAGLGGIVALGKNLIDLGDTLSDVADQTGNTIEVLGGIKPIADQNNSSIDAFAKGMLKAQRTIGEGGEDIAKTFRLIGLDIKDLKQVSPDEFLEKVANALRGVADRNDRAAIATRLFGKAGAELIPTLLAIADKGLPRLSAEAAAGFKALGQLKDKLVEVTGEAANFWAGLIGKAAASSRVDFAESLAIEQKGIQTLLDTMATRGQTAQNNKALADLEYRLAGIIRLREKLQNVPPEKKPAGGGLDLGNADNIKKSAEQLDQFLGGLRKQSEALRISEAELTSGGQAAKALGLDLEFAAFKSKVLSETKILPAGASVQFQKLKTEILDLNRGLATTKSLLDREAVDDKDMAEGLAARVAAGLAPFKLADELEKQRFAEGAELMARDFDDIAQAAREWNDVGLESFKVGDDLAKAMLEINKQIIVMGPDFDALSARINATREAMMKLSETDPEFAKRGAELKALIATKSLGDTAESLIRGGAQGISDSLRSVAMGAQTAGEAFSNMGLAAATAIQNVIFQLLVLKPLIEGMRASMQGKDSAGGGLFGWIGGLIGSFVGLFGGATASTTPHIFDELTFDKGGIVPGPIGAPRLAKVHGGETIFPTHKMPMARGGGGDIHIANIDARGAQRGVSEEIRRAIDQARLMAVNQSVAAVVDERKRSANMARVFNR